MDRLKPHVGLCSLLLVLALIAMPLQSGAVDRAKKQGKTPETKFTLSQAVATAITRNLRLADSRLAVAEKEHQRREAYSDFFPSIDLAYTGTEFRYRNATAVSEVAGASPSRKSAQVVSSVVIPPGITFQQTGEYPYRIDPYRNFSMTATITQPLFGR